MRHGSALALVVRLLLDAGTLAWLSGAALLAQARRLCLRVLDWLFAMALSAESRLREMGITLPAPPASGGNYIPAKTIGSLVFLSGVISVGADGVIAGTVGADRTIEDGFGAARACALTQLGVLRHHLGSLDAVKSIVSVNGYVNAVPGFADSPKVMNGASDLLVEIFGDSGRHVRAAIGVSALPRNALVELQMTVEI